MTGPTGNIEFVSLRPSMFAEVKLRGTLRVSRRQNSMFPL